MPIDPTETEPTPLDVPEIHPPHTHRGRHWLDMVIGLAALITSVVSITVAVRHGETMEKLVEAQSWPYVGLDSSNLVDGKRNISLSLQSAGSGPARVQTLTIRYQGAPVRDWPDLIRACCTSSPTVDDATLLRETAGEVVTSGVVGAVLLPGEKTTILSLPFTEANAVLWERLNVERRKLDYEACYCSVFDECYVSDFSRSGPRHVEVCPAVPDQWAN